MIELSSLVIAFFTGIVSFISPCIIPMIIIYLTTITGFSFDELLKKGKNNSIKRNILIRTVLFVLSFMIVFTLMGGLAAELSLLLPGFFSLMSIIAGILFILLALHYFGILKIVFWRLGSMADISKIDSWTKRWKDKDGSLSYVGVFAVGLIFALVCSHCISPTMFPTLLLAASSGEVALGMLTMFSFSLGLGAAFIITALFFSEVIEKLRWIERNRKIVYIVIGAVFLFFGILLLLGKYLEFISLLYGLVPWKNIGM